MKTIALVPVFNEAPNVIRVLSLLENFVDEILIVNDGSRDESEKLIINWLAEDHYVELVTLGRHIGMSGAMLAGFALLNQRIAEKTLTDQDIVVKIDADMQLKPSDIPALKNFMNKHKLAAVRARRRFEKYPMYKKIGNLFMSWAISVLAGRKSYDVESGFLLLRAETLYPILMYTTGYRYSIADEIAVILPRLGYDTSSDPVVDVPYFKSNTRVRDVVINLALGTTAFFKVLLKIKSAKNLNPKVAKYIKGNKKKAA